MKILQQLISLLNKHHASLAIDDCAGGPELILRIHGLLNANGHLMDCSTECRLGDRLPPPLPPRLSIEQEQLCEQISDEICERISDPVSELVSELISETQEPPATD